MGRGKAGNALLTAAALVIVLTAVKLASALLVPLLLAAMLATVTWPIVPFFKARGMPTSLAVIVAFLADLALIALMIILVERSLVGLDERLPEYAVRLELLAAAANRELVEMGITPDDLMLSPATWIAVGRSLFQSLAGILSNLVLVLLIVVFMLFEATALEAKLSRVLREPSDLARLHSVTREMNKYLAVKLATSAATGVLCAIWCIILGVDFPVLWGLVAFLLNFVPTLGSILAAIPPIALALVQLGVGPAVLVFVGYVSINFTIGNFLEPRILGRTLGLSALVVFLSVVVWGWLLGPVGALLGVPLTMVAKIALESSEEHRWIGTMLGPLRAATALQSSSASSSSRVTPPA
jgi:AI-2 transport protein TqsA